MRVLFLTRYPVEGASSRYRVFQYLPHLERLGVRCEVQSFMDADMYALSFRPGRQAAKAAATARAIARRMAVLRRHREFDAIYMQRELFPLGPPVVERRLKAAGARLLFDYDDALFINKASRYNPLATWLRSPGKLEEVFRLCDRVVAGNDWLRDQAIARGARAVTVEVAEDTDRIAMRPPHTNEGGVLIGWLGSSSTSKYLRLIEPVLRRIHARHPETRFEVVGAGDFAMEGLPLVNTPWSLEGELEALRRFDIGLMPLPMEEWSRGKSGGKARTYMAAGVPGVVAAIGYNLELIRDGETGFLCRDEEDWERHLEALVTDPALRQRVAEAAREDVERRFSPAGQAAELHAVLRDVVEGRARAEGTS